MNHQQRHRPTRRIGIIAALAMIGLAACGGDDAAAPVTTAEVVEADAGSGAESAAEMPGFGLVSPQQALDLSVSDGVTVIDVRTPEEFAEGHIDGATMIDFYTDTFNDEIAALDPNGTYLLYCRSGNRSGQAATLMQQLGFEQVYDMQGGVVEYGSQGLPLVR